MIYRGNPQRQRKYSHINTVSNHSTASKNESLDISPEKKINDIPLPNEVETPSNQCNTLSSPRKPNIISIIRHHIGIEEIIILGIIFLLLEEGIETLEEEFLLIILLYILLS